MKIDLYLIVGQSSRICMCNIEAIPTIMDLLMFNENFLRNQVLILIILSSCMDMAARVGFSLLVLMNLLIYISSTAESAIPRRSTTNPADFIKSSCRATRYPALCVQSLLGYANVIGHSERQLAMTALSVSITRTRSCTSFVKKIAKARGIKPREYRAVQDCIENMGDSVDSLSQSIRELGRMSQTVGEDFAWHMSNVQTWVSAALTDVNTCLDGFGGPALNGNVKAAISDRVANVAQLTSNGLALVNRFASRHRTAADTQTP
ncbi:hypothetical protein RIF29_36774 [Crotalaria pallida]|uniref:Pectinesterase inhibitor domain-containing protein n=1 Tax=Crotalaria pallida TaxID=3830 RepID=A0AAN9EDR9_CROPI